MGNPLRSYKENGRYEYVPCVKCVLLAACRSKDFIDCKILNKAVEHKFASYEQIKAIRQFLKKDYSYRSGDRLDLYNMDSEIPRRWDRS